MPAQIESDECDDRQFEIAFEAVFVKSPKAMLPVDYFNRRYFLGSPVSVAVGEEQFGYAIVIVRNLD